MKAVDGPIPEFWLELMKYLMSTNIFRYFWKIKSLHTNFTIFKRVSKILANTRTCYNKRVLVSKVSINVECFL